MKLTGVSNLLEFVAAIGGGTWLINLTAPDLPAGHRAAIWLAWSSATVMLMWAGGAMRVRPVARPSIVPTRRGRSSGLIRLGLGATATLVSLVTG